ncbi:hypothetical protein ACFL5F_08035 [Planctomycetota bacterium]
MTTNQFSKLRTWAISFLIVAILVASALVPRESGLESFGSPALSTLLSESWRTMPMENRTNESRPPDSDDIVKPPKFKRLRHDPLLLQIENDLRQLNMWDDPSVQMDVRLAESGTERSRARAISQLVSRTQDYEELSVANQDTFMPYATAEQISNNGKGVHILDQAHNGIRMNAPLESFPLCWLILGPQGAGKSSTAFYILQQLSIPKLVLDPKGSWRFRASQLRADYIEAEYLSFDLNPPPNIELPVWLYAYMEGVAYVTGLQYGLGYLYEACDIVIEQHRKYMEQTGENIPLCLKDLFMALQLCTSRNSKQAQYLESSKAALQLLLGKGDLFANRGGLPLETLLSGNYILGCRYPTPVQLRLIAWHILNYEYFQSFNFPETTQPRGVIVFDDSSKVVSRPDTVFGPGSRTSVYLHILSNLRSTGRGVIFMDQLVEPICDDVKQLCNNWLVVGGMRGTRNQSEVASAMCLSREQAAMLGRLETREAICFCPKLYPYAVHGKIPVVPEPEGE